MKGKARNVLLTVAIVAIVLGLYGEEAQIVLTKAIYICLECIGIG